MNTTLLVSEKDPMGAAIAAYHQTGRAGRLHVFSSMFEEDEIPVIHLFRSLEKMSPIEVKALELAEGMILDVGAGSGCHALALQKMGKQVEAIDISPLAVKTMQERGVERAKQENFFSPYFSGQYDTILLLMNGSGIIGKVKNLPEFFLRLKQLLTPQGFVLMDSTDLCYLFENEDGSYDIDLNAGYYGEVDYQMQYGQVKGESFDWLYIDYPTLDYYATENGFKAEVVMEGGHYDYLVKLSRI